MSVRNHPVSHAFFIAASLLLFAPSSAVFAQDDRIDQLIDNIRSGPSVYLTKPAQDLAASKNQFYPGYGPGLQTDLTPAALKSMRAAGDLGEMGSKAWRAIDALISVYPRAIHVLTIHEQYTDQAGGLEDWLATRIASEKNKLLLNPPFLGYDALSRCDGFMVATEEHMTAGERYGKGKRLLEAHVTVHITFTYYSAACALTFITGMSIGTDLAQWQQWRAANPGAYNNSNAATAAVSSPAGGTGIVGRSLADVVLHGTYRFYLSSGDQLVGKVESKDDTSLIVETGEGKAFTFRSTMVEQHELISLPVTAQPAAAPAAGTVGESDIIGYEELLRTIPTGKMLEIRIKSGTVFKGSLSSIDKEMARLSIEGSIIPISRSVVDMITVVKPAAQTAPAASPAAKAPAGPLDTVTVRNAQTDDWGKPLPSLVYVGKILAEKQDYLTMTLIDGTSQSVKTNMIEQVKRHTTSSAEDKIKIYAQPLFCPDGMILIDLPPGKEGRPFFKVCIDRYEYPNIKGSLPRGGLTFTEAKTLCESQGKRVCTAQEWQWACSGLEGYTYPYGYNLDKESCNTNTIDQLENSGNRNRCMSKFGVNDMTGNIFEWVKGADGEPALMGGPMSKCTTISPGVGGTAKPQTGLRCCKSN